MTCGAATHCSGNGEGLLWYAEENLNLESPEVKRNQMQSDQAVLSEGALYTPIHLPMASAACACLQLPVCAQSLPEQNLLRRAPRKLGAVDVPQKMELLPGAPRRGGQ